jgi:hypothetical protein
MATQQGLQYEKNVVKFLQGKGLVEANFIPAGSTADRADLRMCWNSPKKTKPTYFNVELKTESASGGSLVLKWTRGKWHFEKRNEMRDNPEKIFLAELAEDSGTLKELNKAWKGIPTKYANINSSDRAEKQVAAAWKNAKTRKAKDSIYDRELMIFEELNDVLRGDVISRYYDQKDTYYINIGTNGFYRLGNSDPADINDYIRSKGLQPLPIFSNLAKIKWRARVQAKGGGNFQYTFELSFTIPKSANSPYNIGPIRGDGNVRILEREAKLDCFL